MGIAAKEREVDEAYSRMCTATANRFVVNSTLDLASLAELRFLGSEDSRCGQSLDLAITFGLSVTLPVRRDLDPEDCMIFFWRERLFIETTVRRLF